MKLRPLNPGDLVLRKVVGTTKNPAWGKLGPNWEGPYCNTSVVGIEAYFLEDLDENVVLQPWNVLLLMRGSSAKFSFITLCVAFTTYVSIK